MYGIRSVQRASFSRPVSIAQTFPDNDLRATHNRYAEETDNCGCDEHPSVRQFV